MPLTIAKVEAAIAASTGTDKQKRISDGGGGLSLVVRDGAGSWVYTYWLDGKTYCKGLGSAKQLTPAEARAKRDELAVERRRQALIGAAPIVRVKSLSAATASAVPACATLGETVTKYLADHSNDWVPRERVRYQRAIDKHCAPLLELPVNTITVAGAADALRPIWRGPSSGEGSRLRHILEKIIRAAGIHERNPASWDFLEGVLSRKSVPVKHRAAMPVEDVPALFADLAKPQLRPEWDVVSRCLRFCILTATRTQEAIGAHWSEIDMTAKLWTIPASRMKMDREHVIPLSDAAIALLGELGTGPVFTVTNSADGRVGPTFLLKLLNRHRTGVTVHGFRATFGTWAEDRGYEPHVIEAALAHEKEGGNTTKAYRRSALVEARRLVMEAWAGTIAPVR